TVASPQSPFALERARSEEPLFDDFGIGGPSLMGPAPDDLGQVDEPPARRAEREPAPVGPRAGAGRRGRKATAANAAEPALDVADEGALFDQREQAAR